MGSEHEARRSVHTHGPFFAYSLSRAPARPVLSFALSFPFFSSTSCRHAASYATSAVHHFSSSCRRAVAMLRSARWSFVHSIFFLLLLSPFPSSLLRRSFRASNQLVLVICNTNAFIRKQHFDNFLAFSSSEHAAPVNVQRSRRLARTLSGSASNAHVCASSSYDTSLDNIIWTMCCRCMLDFC